MLLNTQSRIPYWSILETHEKAALKIYMYYSQSKDNAIFEIMSLLSLTPTNIKQPIYELIIDLMMNDIIESVGLIYF